MREIKFRCWDEDGYMFYPDSINFLDNSIWVFKGEEYGIVGSAVFLMQYTGLKDKNGKEIYEGDIVRIEKSGAIGNYTVDAKIIYSESKGAFHASGTLCDHLGDFIINVDGKNTGKVIGNIYENPELLK